MSHAFGEHPLTHAGRTSTSDAGIHQAAAAEAARVEGMLAALEGLTPGDANAPERIHEADAAVEVSYHRAISGGGCACAVESWFRQANAKITRAARRVLGEAGEHGRVGWQPTAGVAIARGKKRR
jgi:hypothetical protein